MRAIVSAGLILCAPAIYGETAKAKTGSFRLMETTIDHKQGPTINCVITLNPKAMEEADKLDAAYKQSGPVGPLHGIPILVKDQVDAAGMPTTLGSLVFKDYNPPLDSFVVAKLRKAGAIILGKTT